MWGSFIPYSMPVYPGAFGPTPAAALRGVSTMNDFVAYHYLWLRVSKRIPSCDQQL
jgi:hypothetical protein